MLPVPSRISFAFSRNGAHASCLVSVGGAALTVEPWTFTGAGVVRRTVPSGHGETTWTQLLSLDDGRVLFTRPGRGHHRLVLAEPTGSGLTERPVARIES